MHNLSIYNTLLQRKSIFSPKSKGYVGIYACGVTVYDHCHIGHGRSLFVFSLLKRVLQELGYNVRFVRNITDVDDKIISRIWEQEGYHKISLKELKDFVNNFIASYYEDLRALGLPKADVEPRATEYIDKMIVSIEKLISLGYAYITTNGNVYYSVRKFKDYGKLSHRNTEQLLHGVRKQVEEDKRYPLDFALWKSARENEPSWESPWGMGRPGWHLECAVMSTDLLNGGFDIHGGGMDLIFPHHENEIAEAEPLLEEEFARYWIHHGMVTVDGQKMSKSLGNFITLKEGLKIYPAALWRLWYLTSHYRSPIDFSHEKMRDVAKMYEKISLWYKLLKRNVDKGSNDSDLSKLGVGFYNDLLIALCDDLNTPKALSVLFSFISETFDRVKDGKSSPKLLEYVQKTFSLLFIEPDNDFVTSSLDEDFIALIVKARDILRKHKEYAISDEIRDKLKEKGIIIEDTSSGTRWFLG